MSTPQAPSGSLQQLLWLILVLLVYVGAYSIGLGAYFLLDDFAAFEQNPYLLDLNPARFFDWLLLAESSPAGPSGRPVAMLSFGVDAWLQSGIYPSLIKLGNVGIHCIIGILFYLFSRQIAAFLFPERDERTRILFASLCVTLWLWAPLHVSTVLYPVQRMAQLSTVFVVAGLCVFCFFRARWARDGGSVGEILAAALWLSLFGWLAFHSKENGLLLFWLIPLVELVCFRGVWGGNSNKLVRGLGIAGLVGPVAIAIAYFLLNPEWFLAGFRARDFTLEQRLLTQARVLWSYLGWFVFPTPDRLAFSHDYIELSRSILEPKTTTLALVAWAAVGIVGYRLRNRMPYLALGIGFFAIGHSLESGPLALELVFEHRNYLPSLGLAVLMAGVLVDVCSSAHRRAGVLLLALLLAVSLVTLFTRTHTWADDVVMARASVEKHPDSFRSHYFLARALERRVEAGNVSGEKDKFELIVEARSHYLQMTKIAPDSIAAYTLLYLTDRQYFPGNPEIERWLDGIVRSSEKPRYSASDINALSVLFKCAGDACALDTLRGDAIVRNWLSAQPGLYEANMTAYYWENSRADGVTGPIYEHLEERFASEPRFGLLKLGLDVQRGALDEVYRSLISIYAADSEKRYLKTLKRLIDE